MNPPKKYLYILLAINLLLPAACKETTKTPLDYCDSKVRLTLQEVGRSNLLPRFIEPGKSKWVSTPFDDWTSGFWPGILWYDYEYTADEKIKQEAIYYTELLEPLSRKATSHDLGFQMYCSYGNAYRLTGDEAYKSILLKSAEELAKLYNPTVGTILSWPWKTTEEGWPHNTIMDNMMNLELLFWASKNGGGKELYDMAVSHARVTMLNHFRDDGSCYHVAVYDTISGDFIKGVTHQGYSDDSMWARGQAWAIYGYTMVYRETRDKEFLRFAEKVTGIYLERLPEDYIPYWDFDAPDIPHAPRDASAAAVVASALLELSAMVDQQKATGYKNAALKMLGSLSSDKYQSREKNSAFLLHSTGHYPQGSEIDASIIYADYYYIEALMRLRKMENTTGLKESNLCQYVNPLIGTADNGHTFPGACAPFGLIQASPETGNTEWKHCSGFNYADDTIIGFAQTHLNGTGCPDLGDILLLPFSGNTTGRPYKSSFDKPSQQASPGYYSVSLPDVDVELTCTESTSYHKYTYKVNSDAHLLVDLQSGIVWNEDALHGHVQQSEINMPDEFTITGFQEVKNWVQRKYYFIIKFDQPYSLKETLTPQDNEKSKRMILDFDLKNNNSLQVKVAMSTVSIEGATESLERENPHWDFNAVKGRTQEKWNKLLGRVQIEGTDDEKTNFYTSLYHLYIQPNNMADTDGRYRGANDSISTSPTGEYYSTFSLWDTYRAAHPLYTILTPEKVNGFVHSMLAHHKAQGYLPIWTLWGKENHCMIGNHAIPVIVDAYLKGFDGFDPEEAYAAIRQSAETKHEKADPEMYIQYGYYPFDLMHVESVSRTLESAYDDYCVAQMAKALNKTADYEYFMKRAAFYKNLLDPETKLMRGKDSNGQWRTPFNSFLLSHSATSGGDYTEGNAWQYTWHVQHDIEGLIALMGSDDYFVTKLDSLFFLESTAHNTGFIHDVTGLIGQYAHGNEPSHHVAYMYNYVGRPDKTQALIREIFDRFYLPKPDGLCGNDDCGQMSAWYVFSAMGFYPVNPCGGEYVIGAPQISKTSIKLPNNKAFIVEAKNLSRQNKYVKSVSLNGNKLSGFKINHDDIIKGGRLVFEMTSKPR